MQVALKGLEACLIHIKITNMISVNNEGLTVLNSQEAFLTRVMSGAQQECAIQSPEDRLYALGNELVACQRTQAKSRRVLLLPGSNDTNY